MRGEKVYIDNVRNSIGELENGELEKYLKKLRSVLGRKYKKDVKPSELKQRVDDLVGGRDPKIDYFESYFVNNFKFDYLWMESLDIEEEQA